LIEIGPMPSGGATAGTALHSRLTERHVLALGLSMSAVLLVSAGTIAALTALGGGSPWAAIHLALAGAATVAIGTFMPHFAVTLAGTRPRPVAERVTGIGFLGIGSAAVVVGLTFAGGWLAGVGAAVMLAGLGVVAWQTLEPMRDPLSRRHHVVTLAYGAALAQLAAGIAIGGLAAVNVSWVVAAWANLRPAHAWLSLFGAVSLTIFATLVYLAPTVLGARIRPSPWLVAGVAGMLAGPLTAAIGFALGSVAVVVAGMSLTLVGAVGQLGYVVDAARRRGPFTSEHDWRRVAAWHLGAGPAWFAAAIAAALVGMVGGGRVAGWSIGPLAIPMIAGWLFQELVGSWTHLVPSITPGTPDDHARQRRVLAVASRARLTAINAGVGLAWAGASLGTGPLAMAGGVLIGASVVASVALLARALTIARY
jgi:hypothetical protein